MAQFPVDNNSLVGETGFRPVEERGKKDPIFIGIGAFTLACSVAMFGGAAHELFQGLDKDHLSPAIGLALGGLGSAFVSAVSFKDVVEAHHQQ